VCLVKVPGIKKKYIATLHYIFSFLER